MKRLRRWVGRVQCALDPNWHPGFTSRIGPFYWRRAVVSGQLLSPGNGTIYTQTRRYFHYVCTRCGAPQPEEWASWAS